MDGLGIESCSSSHSSSSLRGLNLINSSSNHMERPPSNSSNSSEASLSPASNSVNFNNGSCESTRSDICCEKRRYNSNVAKKSREKRRMNNMIMEQKLLELTKENNLLRSRLKQQQQQQQQREQQEEQSLRLVTSDGPDTVILSTAQRKDRTVDAIITKVPSLPVSSVTTFATNLANVIGPGTKLPAMFPTHLFAAAAAAAPLLATQTGSIPTPIFPSSGTAPTSLLTSTNGTSQVTAPSVQQLPALQICTLQAALQQVQQNCCSSSGSTVISSGHGAFQPFHSSRDPTSTTQSYSPDSSTTDVTPLDYSMHGTPYYPNGSWPWPNHTLITFAETPSDPSHVLWYSRMLEQETHVSTETETEQRVSTDLLAHSSSSSDRARESDPDEKPRSLLGSLLSTKRTSPLVAQSRTDTHSGLNNTSPKDSDLKNCLSSLAVNVSSALAVPAGTRTVTTNASSSKSDAICCGTLTTKSDSSDSMESSTSNNSTTDSIRSQLSPPPKHSAIVKALRSRPSSKQQYMDRRRRNNEAAKRCRANRRAQFEYRSKRAQQLEAENDELRREMSRLNQELEQLKALHAVKSAAILQR